MRKYGLTEESFDSMLAAQGWACAACGAGDPGGNGTWHIDHDHACCPWGASDNRLCGECNRGLLCARCNIMLGMACDEVGVLEGLIAYLGERRVVMPSA